MLPKQKREHVHLADDLPFSIFDLFLYKATANNEKKRKKKGKENNKTKRSNVTHYLRGEKKIAQAYEQLAALDWDAIARQKALM